jgi:hypothetical protein
MFEDIMDTSVTTTKLMCSSLRFCLSRASVMRVYVTICNTLLSYEFQISKPTSEQSSFSILRCTHSVNNGGSKEQHVSSD